MDTGRDRLLSGACHASRHACCTDNRSLYADDASAGQRETESAQGVVKRGRRSSRKWELFRSSSPRRDLRKIERETEELTPSVVWNAGEYLIRHRHFAGAVPSALQAVQQLVGYRFSWYQGSSAPKPFLARPHPLDTPPGSCV